MPDNILSDTKNSSVSVFPDPASKDLKLFIAKLFNNTGNRYATFTFPIEAIDPLAYLEMCWENTSFQYYWEKPVDEFAIAARGKLVNISACGKNRFEDINTKFRQIQKQTAEYSALPHPYSGMLFLGGFSFTDNIEGKSWKSFSPASITVPKQLIIKDGKLNLVTIAVDIKAFNSPDKLYRHLRNQLQDIEETLTSNTQKTDSRSSETEFRISPSQKDSEFEKWISSVTKAKALIRQQYFEKIVLARKVTISKNPALSPTQVLNKLRQQYTNCYNFLIHNASGKTFLGSTPERLGTFRNQLMLTEALAGSIQRGETATEDTILEKNLSGSIKNRNEHKFVLKDIEERLQPLVDSLDRNDQPEVKKLFNVQHLYTPIRAQLKAEIGLLDAICRLHPTPAVGGYPWHDAAPYINELEDFERGWYAGPVGWFNTKERGEFAVAIRSGLLTKSEAHFFAGCGIVEDSDPSAEWEETNLKLKPMFSALQYD